MSLNWKRLNGIWGFRGDLKLKVVKNGIHADSIPLIIAILLIVSTLGVVLFTDTTISFKYYLGILLVAVSVFLYLKKRNLYQYVFGITLLMGFVDVIDVFYVNMLFMIGPIQFNPIFLILIILFVTFNQTFFEKLFSQEDKNSR